MEQNNYKNSEQVIYTAKGHLIASKKESQEVDINIIEGHVVIDAEEQIKIPIANIKNTRIEYTTSPGLSIREESYKPPREKITLTFISESMKKNSVTLEATAWDRREINNQIREQQAKISREIKRKKWIQQGGVTLRQPPLGYFGSGFTLVLGVSLFSVGVVMGFKGRFDSMLAVGILGILFILLAFWMLTRTTEILINNPPGYITVRSRAGYFALRKTTKCISKEEAKTVSVSSYEPPHEGYRTTIYEVFTLSAAGKNITLYEDKNHDAADDIAQIIQEFGQ